MKINSVKNIKYLAGQRVLVRVDFNVPIKNGVVKEEFKVEKALPTIVYLLRHHAKVILISHLGRPKKGYEKKYSLKPLAETLHEMLKIQIKFLSSKKFGDNYFKLAAEEIEKMENGEVILLENVRFFTGEEDNDKKVSEKLSGLADYFVLDGFAVAHRNSSSVSGVAEHLPSYAGLLLEEEIEGLKKVLENPKRPFVLMLAGIKIETKIPVLKRLLPLADQVLLGGGIFNTYLAAKGYKMGESVMDKDFYKEAIEYCEKSKVFLPIDVVVGRSDGKEAKVYKIDKKFAVRRGMAVLDVGPETIKLFSKYIKKAETLVWNGALGKFESHPYEYGTYAIARLLAARSNGKCFGVCGGGETVEILKKLHLLEDIDLVSTGGGAMLEFLSGKELPGIKKVSIK